MTNRSLCYASMKNWAKSLRDADKAIALKPDWEKASRKHKRNSSRLHSSKFAPSEHSTDARSLSCFSLSACPLQGWYRRGVALSNLGRYEEAMAAFQKCLDMNSSSKDYQQQYEQAKKDLYKGLTESEILKMEGNEVSTAQRKGKPSQASRGGGGESRIDSLWERMLICCPNCCFFLSA